MAMFLFVHAKDAEDQFVADGWGVKRYDVMYNDFVIVGPATDPAKLSGLRDAQSALKHVADSQAVFVSRGDDSGTHKKERELWQLAGIDPTTASGTWYRETGSGMGASLNTAVGMSGYTLSDRGTWISFKNKADFRVLVEGDPQLFNQYGVILVNPAKHPHVKAAEGQQFIDWLLGPEGQRLIADYQIEGQQLFFRMHTGAEQRRYSKRSRFYSDSNRKSLRADHKKACRMPNQEERTAPPPEGKSTPVQ